LYCASYILRSSVLRMLSQLQIQELKASNNCMQAPLNGTGNCCSDKHRRSVCGISSVEHTSTHAGCAYIWYQQPRCAGLRAQKSPEEGNCIIWSRNQPWRHQKIFTTVVSWQSPQQKHAGFASNPRPRSSRHRICTTTSTSVPVI